MNSFGSSIIHSGVWKSCFCEMIVVKVIYTAELNPYSMSQLIQYPSMLKMTVSKKVSMPLKTWKICFNLQKNHGGKSTQRVQFTLLLSIMICCILICLGPNLWKYNHFFFHFPKASLRKLELIWLIQTKKMYYFFRYS